MGLRYDMLGWIALPRMGGGFFFGQERCWRSGSGMVEIGWRFRGLGRGILWRGGFWEVCKYYEYQEGDYSRWGYLGVATHIACCVRSHAWRQEYRKARVGR